MQKFELRGGLFAALAAAIFLFIAVFHGLRAYYGWEVTIESWAVPVWLSWLITFVGFIMSITAIRRL